MLVCLVSFEIRDVMVLVLGWESALFKGDGVFRSARVGKDGISVGFAGHYYDATVRSTSK